MQLTNNTHRSLHWNFYNGEILKAVKCLQWTYWCLYLQGSRFPKHSKAFLFISKNIFLWIVKIHAKVHLEQEVIINKRMVISLTEWTHRRVSDLRTYYSHDVQMFKARGVRRKQSKELKANKQYFRYIQRFFITMSCNIATRGEPNIGAVQGFEGLLLLVQPMPLEKFSMLH